MFRGARLTGLVTKLDEVFQQPVTSAGLRSAFAGAVLPAELLLARRNIPALSKKSPFCRGFAGLVGFVWGNRSHIRSSGKLAGAHRAVCPVGTLHVTKGVAGTR